MVRLALSTSLICAAVPAYAGPAPSDVESRALSAAPNAPVAEFKFQGSARGQVSVRLPLIGRDRAEGFQLELQPLIALHNAAGNKTVVPASYWRGYLAVHATYRKHVTLTSARDVMALRFTVEHESDHPTNFGAFVDEAWGPAPPLSRGQALNTRLSTNLGQPTYPIYGENFVSTNAVALMATTTLHQGPRTLTASFTPKLYFLSCTVHPLACFPGKGSWGHGWNADLIVT